MKPWKCPNCGDYEIEEVCTGVVQFAVITDISIINGDLYIEGYKNLSYSNGEFSHFECGNCGYQVAEDSL